MSAEIRQFPNERIIRVVNHPHVECAHAGAKEEIIRHRLNKQKKDALFSDMFCLSVAVVAIFAVGIVGSMIVN